MDYYSDTFLFLWSKTALYSFYIFNWIKCIIITFNLKWCSFLENCSFKQQELLEIVFTVSNYSDFSQMWEFVTLDFPRFDSFTAQIDLEMGLIQSVSQQQTEYWDWVYLIFDCEHSWVFLWVSAVVSTLQLCIVTPFRRHPDVGCITEESNWNKCVRTRVAWGF